MEKEALHLRLTRIVEELEEIIPELLDIERFSGVMLKVEEALGRSPTSARKTSKRGRKRRNLSGEVHYHPDGDENGHRVAGYHPIERAHGTRQRKT